MNFLGDLKPWKNKAKKIAIKIHREIRRQFSYNSPAPNKNFTPNPLCITSGPRFVLFFSCLKDWSCSRLPMLLSCLVLNEILRADPELQCDAHRWQATDQASNQNMQMPRSMPRRSAPPRRHMKQWADPGVLWKKAPRAMRAMRAMRGKTLETVPFQPYFGCTKSFLKVLSN